VIAIATRVSFSWTSRNSTTRGNQREYRRVDGKTASYARRACSATLESLVPPTPLFHRDVVHLHPRVVITLGGLDDLVRITLLSIEHNLESMAETADQQGIHVVLGALSSSAGLRPGGRAQLREKIDGSKRRYRCGGLQDENA
jgi:hypothetical protein